MKVDMKSITSNPPLYDLQSKIQLQISDYLSDHSVDEKIIEHIHSLVFDIVTDCRKNFSHYELTTPLR